MHGSQTLFCLYIFTIHCCVCAQAICMLVFTGQFYGNFDACMDGGSHLASCVSIMEYIQPWRWLVAPYIFMGRLYTTSRRGRVALMLTYDVIANTLSLTVFSLGPFSIAAPHAFHNPISLMWETKWLMWSQTPPEPRPPTRPSFYPGEIPA